MLITILSYFDRIDNNEDYYNDNHSTESPTGSIVRDTMAFADNNEDVAREEDGWEQISIPISVEEDYEIVIPPSDFPGTEDLLTSTRSSDSNSSLFQRVREWRHQRSLQRNQLGRSISKTFTELSKEDPNQMEEEAIQRAMELSMLDVALVHTNYYPNNRKQKQQHQLPHDILGVAENACPTEIKTAYRRLARLHVSKGYNISLYNTIVVEMLLLRRSRRVHCTYIDDYILTLSYQCPSATLNNELAPRQRR